jgi:hypothetical protein
MIMASLKIKLCGIGICYEKDDCWNVLFPVNQDHRLFFCFDAFKGIKVPLDTPGRVFEIVADSGPSPASGSLNKLIDLTEKQSGKNNPGLHTNGIKRQEHWRDYGVLLRVRGGIFHQGDTMFSRYMLTKNGKDHRPAEHFGYSAEIILPGRAGFLMTWSGRGALPIAGTSQINFDNTCPNCPTDDDDADFSMVYKVIEDVDGHTEFKLKRHPDDAPHPKLVNKLLGPLSSFGPVLGILTNPRVGDAGLPCNLVGASDSTSLPGLDTDA